MELVISLSDLCLRATDLKKQNSKKRKKKVGERFATIGGAVPKHPFLPFVETTYQTALALSSPSATPDHGILKMKLYPTRRSRSLRSTRSVHFPNDVVFLDHIRQGDLEQVGRFIRARKVTLDKIYLTGEGIDS